MSQQPTQRSKAAYGTKLTYPCVYSFVRFSNRPFRVKRFQTIHHYSVDVAHGLVLLFGIGTRGPCMALSLSRNLPGPRIFFLRRFLDLISKSVSSSRPAHR